MNNYYLDFKQLCTVLLLGTGIWMLTACDILEVDNPNNLIEDELADPAAAVAIANGSEAAVTRALGAIYAPYSTVTDEVVWIGSRDGWERLNFGELDDPSNEFTDNAFSYVAEARWTADEAIRRLEAFRDEGTLRNDNDLARSYLYGAIIYITIADMFEDYAFSDRREGGPAVGPANMSQLYDTAIGYLNEGETIASAQGNTYLEAYITALRARAHFNKATRAKVFPNIAADPLVNDASAVQNAEDALALMGGEDSWYRLEQNSSTPGLPVGDMSLALQVNVRAEIKISGEYAETDGAVPTGILLEDPIDNVPDPILSQLVDEFTNQERYADFNIVSAREMHLILAEAALAQNDSDGFEEHINAIRSFDDEQLTDYEGQIPELDMLIHSRRVNLFLQGRRLIDHYRFGQPSPYWSGSSAASQSPGTLFPITITERRANPNL